MKRDYSALQIVKKEKNDQKNCQNIKTPMSLSIMCKVAIRSFDHLRRYPSPITHPRPPTREFGPSLLLLELTPLELIQLFIPPNYLLQN